MFLGATMSELIYPPPLRPGDTIGIIAPAAYSVSDELDKAVAWLHELGYAVKLGATVKKKWGYLAGTDEERARDIEAAFGDDNVKGILCLRGGYGVTRILDLIDFPYIKKHPKLFIGFSDITALHSALQKYCGFAVVHGPMALSLGRKSSAFTRASFAAMLSDPWGRKELLLPPGRHMETLVAGKATGILAGGNLMLLAVTTGTSYALGGKDLVLVLEEVGESAYSLDRMFRQLEQGGLIERAKAVLFGEFHNCEPQEETDGNFTIRQVVEQYAERWSIPAVWGLPVGHGPDNASLPLGTSVTVCAEAEKIVIVYGTGGEKDG
ncbi:LD-carboxypeptidase [Anaeroglobus geminatus F0357]|uniref:LD-carboxypeptidase n=2 Tax=Anaeroglobus TaxID=156454 RepID=G9YGR8_9FIRM|nr:LD-carboxypeptidase [Anaeroglobus geminatus F0357]